MLRDHTFHRITVNGVLQQNGERLRSFWLRFLNSRVNEDLPDHRINCLTAFAFGIIYLIIALSIVSDDVTRIGKLFGSEWEAFHIAFRSACCVVASILTVRGAMRVTTKTDYMAFLVLGMLHTLEGTLFNTSYYLSYIQFVVLYGWFSNLHWRPFTVIVAISGLLYSCLLTRVGKFQGVDPSAMNDLVIAVIVATISGPLAAIFRSHWQDMNQRLLRKHIEDNARLIDLGRHLGIICHDIGNALCLLRYGVLRLEEVSVPNLTIESTISQLSQATTHIETIQRFVLGLARQDKGDIVWIEGPALRSFVQTMTSDICWEVRSHLSVICNERISYFCSPPALTFAIINAVNNSARASRNAEGRLPEGFHIDMVIDQNDAGEMTVLVRDNGPGFPTAILPSLFSPGPKISANGGSGLGLQNMLRYVSHQGGRVRGYNHDGAVVEFTIPQR